MVPRSTTSARFALLLAAGFLAVVLIIDGPDQRAELLLQLG
jgi:hypothetical protein